MVGRRLDGAVVSVRGALTVAAVEFSKLIGQLKIRITLTACIVSPFVFAAAMAVQSALPEDTLFGRSVKDSGFAIPLVILGFAALWVFPALTSVVGGDMFSAEDRYATWATVLTRSRSRAEVFGGKIVDGVRLLPRRRDVSRRQQPGCWNARHRCSAGGQSVRHPPFTRRSAAHCRAGLGSVVPPSAFTALSLLVSVATRSSAAGIGLPVLIGLAMQGLAFIDGRSPSGICSSCQRSAPGTGF